MSVSTKFHVGGLSVDEAREIAIEAYVYLYPLVLMETTRRQMTNAPAGAVPGFGPPGAFSHLREYPRAGFGTVVRPNLDTLYSVAWLDLTAEPMIVSTPDTSGRYYLMPLYDMWTDAFAVPGARTTGAGAADYVVVPPSWAGELPAELPTIQAPTPYVWIIGRTQTNGPSDYAAVHRVQDGFAITALSRRNGPAAPAQVRLDMSVDMETPPLEQVNAMPSREFFRLAADLMALHAPHVTDWSIVARMRRIGLRPGSFGDEELEPAARRALDDARDAGLELVRSAPLGKVVDGWQMSTDTMGVYGNFYLKRATVAMVGLGANPVEDAIYPLAVADAEGRPVSGDHDYVLHFDRADLPPVAAFWSVTMYDADGFPAANPLDRYALGDRDPLRFQEDGALDIYLQHDSPGADRESNWLPSPRGPVGVTMRLYAPEPEVLDGRWNPPPLRRTA